MKDIKTYYKSLIIGEDEVYSIVSKRVSTGDEENDYYSNVENEIHMTVNKDGAVMFSDYGGGEGYIYIYPDQLEHLKMVVNTAVARKYEIEEESKKKKK